MSLIGTKIEEFTSKSGKKIILRHVRESDAEELCRYINALSQEDTFITFSGEHVTLDEEKAYINDVTEKIENHNMVKIVAEDEGEIVGAADVTRDLVGKKRSYHMAGFGLSIDAAYRGEGIGERLMRVAINEGKKHIDGLKIISLSVYEPNLIGQSLYKKLGFKEYGRIPKGILYRGEYVDEIRMYLEV